MSRLAYNVVNSIIVTTKSAVTYATATTLLVTVA
jgi:hypothetical protein